MNRRGRTGSGLRFERYVDSLVSVIGHADRAGPLRDYCVGLMLPSERKSVEPMAALTAPHRTAAQHQSLLHFVGNAAWSDEKVLAKVRELVLPVIERQGPIEAWIIDDTSFPKKGRHSVGVTRQYCGQLGKQDNCQVAVSLSIANHHASLPVAYRLYLPESWAVDADRRRKAEVPEDIAFKTKPEIALEQIRQACEADIPRGPVLMDPAYGNDARLRTEIRKLGLSYVAGIQSNTLLWMPGTTPQHPPKKGRRFQPLVVSAKEIALGLPRKAWRTVRWREGSADWLSSRFARVRVHAAHKYQLGEMQEEWLLIEWPHEGAEPTKYWLATLPESIALRDLVDSAKLRWRIERDYLELKQEVGLGHFEGRRWRGFHHHASLCIAAYGFLISERETIPPSRPRSSPLFEKPALPKGRPPSRTASSDRETHSKLGRHDAATADHRSDQPLAAMSMLRSANAKKAKTRKLMTQ